MRYIKSKDGETWLEINNDNKKLLNDVSYLSDLYNNLIVDFKNYKDFKLLNISIFEEKNISILINYRIGLEHKQIRYQKEF